MSRTQESGLESKKRRFAEVGILFDIEPSGKMEIALQGTQGSVSLTGWLTQATGYSVQASPERQNSICEHKDRLITIGTESFTDPIPFILTVLHEMGHAFDTPKINITLKRELQDSNITWADKLVGTLFGLLERSEREAWEWVFRALVRLKIESGWDIRQKISSASELGLLITPQYLSYKKGALTCAVMLTPDFKLSQEESEMLQRKLSDLFNPKYFEFLAEQLWKQLS